MNKATNLSLLCLFLSLFYVTGCTEKHEGEYDPDKDPLVNTPEMFEAPPEDLSLIDTNESLIVTFNASPNTGNPLFSSSVYDALLTKLVYQSLFIIDDNFRPVKNPNVVTDWKASGDHTEVTVHLRKDLKWQDGKKLTADDYVFAMEMVKNDKVPCYAFKSEVEDVIGYEAIDDYTLKYKLGKPIATYLDAINYPLAPLPRHLYQKEIESHPDLKSGKYFQELAMRPVGNGPYKIIEWVENDKIVFERWEDYPGKKPYLKQIIFKFQPDVSMALLAFKSGETDVVEEISSQQCALETNDEKTSEFARKYAMPSWAYTYTGWNMDGSNPFFVDKKVRQAMAYSYDASLFKKKLSYNLVTQAYGIFHPTSWMFNDQIERFPFDLDKAAELLDQAGWKMSKDGWRHKDVSYVLIEKLVPDKLNPDKMKKVKEKIFLRDGQSYQLKDGETFLEEGTENRKFEFTILTTPYNGLPRPGTLIWQTDLRKIGINLIFRLSEWTSFLERIRKHDMQAWSAGWVAGTDPDSEKGSFRMQDYVSGRNYGGYCNPQVDELFEKAKAEFDRDKRAEYYRQIQELIYDDQPYLFSFNYLRVSLVNKRIRGLTNTYFGFCNNDQGFYQLWVPMGEGERPVN